VAEGEQGGTAQVLAAIHALTFEGYVSFLEVRSLAEQPTSYSPLLERLLFDRLRRPEVGAWHIYFAGADRRGEQNALSLVHSAASAAEERARTTVTRDVRFTQRSDGCLVVSDLVCDAVLRMLFDPSDRAAYDQLETKIRLVHDSGRDVFYSRRHPFRGRAV
jgi:hypothetical protein